MDAELQAYRRAIHQARLALKKGDRRAARRWAEQAAALAPNEEDPWLLLAGIASPKASLVYLRRALEINPQSNIARKGMHWAIQRYRALPPPARRPRPVQAITLPAETTSQRRGAIYPGILVLVILMVSALFWWGAPALTSANSQPANMMALAQAWLQKASLTPSITPTFTPTPTPTSTATPTETPTLTASPIPTRTEIPTATHIPTATPEAIQEVGDAISLPSEVAKGEIWIDVDLTHQQLHVYKGKNLLDSFIVSTGTWRTPTVTGQYRIYVKYAAADMTGPGYYLPNVPYVMYFYEGYGIHGTYWHNNFGTPMSHGCVNLETNHAEWVYNMASVGTVVNIHY